MPGHFGRDRLVGCSDEREVSALRAFFAEELHQVRLKWQK
jgi:hypothetical protein